MVFEQHPEIKQIIFALDNDIDGKAPDGSPCNHGQEAAKKFCAKYAKLGYDTAVQAPAAKDFNEDLTNIRNARSADRAIPREVEQEQDNGFEP